MDRVSGEVAIGIGVVCGILGYAIGSQSASNESDRERIAYLERELQSRSAVASSPSTHPGLRRSSFAPSDMSSNNRSARERSLPQNYTASEEDIRSTLEETADQALLNFDAFLTLSDAEREQLRASFVEKPDLSDEQRITELFGAPKWEEYSKSLQKIEEEGETNAREFEVFQLSRRLKLTPDQSQQIEEALLKVAKEFPNSTADEPAIDPATPPSEIARMLKAREAAAVEAEQKRTRRTRELLQQILPEAQFNAYLEYSGESAAVPLPAEGVSE